MTPDPVSPTCTLASGLVATRAVVAGRDVVRADAVRAGLVAFGLWLNVSATGGRGTAVSVVAVTVATVGKARNVVAERALVEVVTFVDDVPVLHPLIKATNPPHTANDQERADIASSVDRRRHHRPTPPTIGNGDTHRHDKRLDRTPALVGAASDPTLSQRSANTHSALRISPNCPFADFITVRLGDNLNTTTAVMSILLVVALIVQFRARNHVPAIYWVTVVLIGVVGTLRDRRHPCRSERSAGQRDPVGCCGAASRVPASSSPAPTPRIPDA